MTTTLINAFEVPPGQEEDFLKAWNEALEYMRQAPGYISTRLHKSLDPRARFRFVNVAQWQSPQHFQAAIKSEGFAQISRTMPFTSFPALYEVVVED